MAGAYPDYPAPRRAYHLDGTTGARYTASNVIEETFDASDFAVMNLEDGSASYVGLSGSGDYAAFVFPELLDIVGLYLECNGPTLDLLSSTDSTNGADGTFTARGSLPAVNPIYPSSRTNIASYALTGVRALRLAAPSSNHHIRSFQIFATPTVADADRLAIWHPTDDEPVDGSHFDWGDAPRITDAVRQFRVKNRSTTLTAEDVAVSLVDSTDSSPSYTDAHTLSEDGSSFASGLSNIGDLDPEEISDVLFVKRTFDDDQPLALWSAIIKASAGSWV